MAGVPASYFLSVDEMFEGRDGTAYQAYGDRTYVRKFQVRVRDKGLGPIAVCSAPGLPLAMSPYVSAGGLEFDLLAVCVGLSAKQKVSDDWQFWIVTAEYSTKLKKNSQSPAQDNDPTMDPPELEWDFEVVQRAVPYDLNKNPFMNSASEPFTPAPTFERASAVMVYSRNEPSFSLLTACRYAFAVNSAPFIQALPGQAQCLPPKAKLMQKGLFNYYRVTYRIRFVPDLTNTIDTWQPQFLDQGVNRIQSDVNKPDFNHPIPITRNRIPITKPVPLDGNGQPAVMGPNNRIKTKWLPFTLYRAIDFNQLFLKGVS